MIDFALLNNTGDLDLSSGDLKLVAGLRATSQNIGTRFRFQKGEWFLDRRVGSPIFDDGSGNGSIAGATRGELEIVRGICNQIIEGAPGISEVISLDLDLSANRALTVKWQARGTSGDFITGTETLIFGEL